TSVICWGHSSVGRALEWHSRGRGFDSPWLHQPSLASQASARQVPRDHRSKASEGCRVVTCRAKTGGAQQTFQNDGGLFVRCAPANLRASIDIAFSASDP